MTPHGTLLPSKCCANRHFTCGNIEVQNTGNFVMRNGGYFVMRMGGMIIVRKGGNVDANTQFAVEGADEASARLMQTMDLINRKMGKDTIFIASAGIRKHWQMKQGNKSPCYTTSWGELAEVQC